MKILFLQHGGANSSDRRDELRRLGHDVTTDFLYPQIATSSDRTWHRLAAHLKIGPWIQRANDRLVGLSKSFHGFDLVWLEKSLYVRKETVEAIRRAAGCPIVQFTPDVAIQIRGTQKSPIYLHAVPAYDAIITTKDYEVAGYKGYGARLVVLTNKAASHRRFFPAAEVSPQERSEIGFIGHREAYYMKTLFHLERAGLQPTVFGPRWEERLYRLHPQAGKFPRGPAVRGDAYRNRLSGMKIGLGLLTKLGPDTITARTLEIPACGTFLLAERTQSHQELFEEGKEAEFFDSVDELIEKAKFYLHNDAKRESIARSGYEKFLQSDARLDRQMASLMSQLRSGLDLPE